MKKSYLLFSLTALMFSACKPNIEPDSPSANGIDFSKYVSIGNSLTAGGADGTLYKSGQLYSYPSILAEQFKTVGGGEFKQPLLPGESGWPIDPVNGFLPRYILEVSDHCNGVSSLGPAILLPPYDTMGSSVNISSQGPFNNVGVFGIRAIDYLFPGYAMYNPYAGRFFANPLGTPLDEATRIQATFFTMWLGTNDVLGYAISGGEGGGIGGTHDLSDLSTFQFSYDSVVNAMTKNGAKGALINIPDITSLPFFTTIPSQGVVLRQGEADTLNLMLTGSGISFNAGPNRFIIQDGASLRHMTAGEFILLSTPQDSLTCAGWGIFKPIPSNYVLTSAEVANITTATAAFNAVIQAAAAAHNLAYVDIKSYLQTLNTGIKFNGADYSANLQSGASFSLDGLHPSPRGYALIANEVLRTIDNKYGSRIPVSDVNKYPGAHLP